MLSKAKVLICKVLNSGAGVMFGVAMLGRCLVGQRHCSDEFRRGEAKSRTVELRLRVVRLCCGVELCRNGTA